MEPQSSGNSSISPTPPAPVRSNLACRLFNDATAIPAHLDSDTDNAAMAVDATPFTNSIPETDYWEQLVLEGNEPEFVAAMGAEALATTKLDTSHALDAWLLEDQSNVPPQLSSCPAAIAPTPAATVIPVTEVDFKPSRNFCTEPIEFGPAETSNLAQVRRQQGTSKPYPQKSASPTKDEVKAENNMLNEVVIELKENLEKVSRKTSTMVCCKEQRVQKCIRNIDKRN